MQELTMDHTPDGYVMLSDNQERVLLERGLIEQCPDCTGNRGNTVYHDYRGRAMKLLKEGLT